MGWRSTGLTSPEVADEPAFVEVDGVSVVLVRDRERVWAAEDACSHAHCSFSTDGEIDGLTAVCNCHGSEFDIRTGDVLAMPATAPIRTFPVRTTGGRLEIDL